MKIERKKIILILILILIISAIIAVAVFTIKLKTKKINKTNTEKEEFVQVLGDGTKSNISNKLKEEKDLDGLKIRNIQLTEQNGQSVLLANVTNTTSKDVNVFLIDIIFYDKEGKEIATVPGIISSVKAGETIQLNAGITENCANAYNFKIIKK